MPGRDAPAIPFQMQAPRKMLPATSRALHPSPWLPLLQLQVQNPKAAFSYAQNDTKDTAKQSRHLLMLAAQAVGWQQGQVHWHLPPPLQPLPRLQRQPEQVLALPLCSVDRQQHEGKERTCHSELHLYSATGPAASQLFL